jgi:hypothetical protein
MLSFELVYFHLPNRQTSVLQVVTEDKGKLHEV